MNNSSIQISSKNEHLEVSSLRMSLSKTSPSIGFRNIFSNITFLNFLQYFGDEDSREETGYALSPNYLAATIEHDPFYRPFYLFLSESTTFHGGMPNKTVSIMNDGLSFFDDEKPDDSYYIWRYKGIDELLFLEDSRLAQKSFETAAAWAAESNDEDSATMTLLSQRTADSLSSNPDNTQAKISAWSSILTTALDEETRARAIVSIRKLGGEVTLTEDGQIQIEYAKAGTLRETNQPDI